MFAKFAFVTAALVRSSLACLASSSGIPTASATHSNTEPIEVAAGQVFDGQLAKYDRGSGACSSGEGGQADAVFIVREGGTLKNVIIGADQQEGVYCLGSCTLEEIWFEDVCEDAISIKEDAAGSESWIIEGGAYNAGDKIVQHNGCGKVNIVNFYAENYGKVYRSCGNCETQCARTVSINGVTAKNGGEIAGINENYGDTATLTNVCADTTSQCVTYSGCAGGCSPEKVGTC